MADAFQHFAEEYAVYGYPVLFAGVLLENAGVPVPGETAVLVAGFLSSPAGGGHFHIGWVILLTVVAAVLGDNLGFWLGQHWARPRLKNGKGFLFLTPNTLRMADGYFSRFGLWTVFLARFIAGLRVVAALAAGTAGMSWPHFFVANTAGALVWAATISCLGYFFGHSWELLHQWMGRGALILIGSAIVLVGLPYLLRHLRKLSPGELGKLLSAQVLHGILVATIEVVCLALLVLLAQEHRMAPIDAEVQKWVTAHDTTALQTTAKWASEAGALPVVTLVTVAMLAMCWRRGRHWRECSAMAWALIASELVGLVLLGLLQAHHLTPVKGPLWPFGFAGLVPLRVFAVMGMAAFLSSRQGLVNRRWSEGIAGFIIILAGFGVVWTGTQTLTETLLEFVAGGVILFAGIWWLEGFGPGWVADPQAEGERN